MSGVNTVFERKSFSRFLSTFLLALCLSNTAIAQDRDEAQCSNQNVAGEWGYSTTGTLFLPPAGTPTSLAQVGRFTLDQQGNLLGSQTSVVGNLAVNPETFSGTITVNPDCRATATIEIFNRLGILDRTATLDFVFVDKLRGYRAVFTSVTARPSGFRVSTVLLIDGKKIQ
jgi:hypothetical protein